MVIEHNGKFYITLPYTQVDLAHANMVYNCRERSVDELDSGDKDRIKHIKKCLKLGAHKLVPIEECQHVWVFRRNEFGMDAYFQCKDCNQSKPYDPSELADMQWG